MLLSSLFQNFSHTSGLSSLPSFRSLKSAKPADVSKRTSIVKSCELREREGKRTKAFEPKKSSNGERKKGSENIGVELSARFGHFFSSFFSLVFFPLAFEFSRAKNVSLSLFPYIHTHASSHPPARCPRQTPSRLSTQTPTSTSAPRRARRRLPACPGRPMADTASSR